MQRNVQIFADVAARVPSASLFNEIIKQQKHLYDVQPYKIQRTQGQTMLDIYIKLVKRYNTSNELILDNNSWSQNERRVFVWFILCYTYFLQLDKKQFKDTIYEQLSPVFFDKKPQFLHFQHLNLMKNKRKLNWTKQEDQILLKCIQYYNPGKWNEISKKIFYDSNRKFFRAPKQCRQRWLNHLDKNKKHGDWKPQEDTIILEYVLQNGKRWSKIVPLLNETRTQHMIKNRYNSLISKSKEGKNIKEEDVAKKILDSITQVLYSQQNNQSKKQQINGQILEGQKKIILAEQNTRILQNLSNNLSLCNSQILSHNNSKQVGCPFYYNYLIYPQIFSNKNRYELYPLSERTYQQMELSKNSSFSFYQPSISF